MKFFKKLLSLFVFLTLFIFYLNSTIAQNTGLRIHFIDVGEGDSVLVEAPNGKSALIDCGNLVSGFRVVEYLRKNNINNLDYLIFTHPHLDHIGGAFFVLQMQTVRNIYDNGQSLSAARQYSDIYRWYEALVRKNKNYRILKAKDRLSLGGGVVLNILWPPGKQAFSDFNANSVVIMLEYGQFRCLFTGDLTSEAESVLLGQGGDLKSDVLKAGHHGAKDASSKEFLDRVSPKISVISVDANNIYGFPDNLVIERLKETGSAIYRTDKDGDIVLRIHRENHKEPEVQVSKNTR